MSITTGGNSIVEIDIIVKLKFVRMVKKLTERLVDVRALVRCQYHSWNARKDRYTMPDAENPPWTDGEGIHCIEPALPSALRL